MSDINGNNNCDICTNESNEFFFCSSSHDKIDETPFDQKQICRICIGSHLQQNHEVKNQKGLKPLICKIHKMLQLEFCRTCDEVICWGCMSKHSKHEFGSLDDRASEVRKKVFESLSEFENEEKLMNAVKAEIVEKIEKHEAEQKSLREKFLAEVEKLKQTGLKTIDDNCRIMKEHLKAVDDVVEIQQKLRDLLSVSNDHLVNKFREIDKELKQLRIASGKMKEEKAALLTCDVDRVVAKLEQLQSSIAADLKSVLFDNSACYFCWDESGKGYRVALQKGKFLVEDVTIDNSGGVAYTNCKTQVLNEEVTHCFSIVDTSHKLTILLITNNKAYLFDPSEANLTLSTVPCPAKTHFLWPYYVQNQNNFPQPHWSYWEDGVIKFTHNASFTVQCDAIPSVRMEQHLWCWLFFISPDDTVILADVYRNKHTRFTFSDIERIGCCVPYSIGDVFFISADGTCFYTLCWVEDFKLSEPVKHNWNNQSNVMSVSVNNSKYSITKAKTNPSHSQYPYSFKVTRV